MSPDRAMPAWLETARLHLRDWRADDAGPLHEMWAERDPRARHRIDPEGHPTVDELRQHLVREAVESERTGLRLLAMELREVPGVIGYCGLIVGQATEDEPEIAYELLRRFHEHGYATEAAEAIVAAADAAGWTRLWSTVREWNAPSRKVMAKIGFAESGRTDPDPIRGDSIWYVRNRLL